LRQDKDYTQAKIGNKFEVHANTWKDYEKGKRNPRWELLDRISDEYDLSLDYIFGNHDIKFNPKDVNIQELIKLYLKLSPENQLYLLKSAKNIKKSQK